MQKAKYTSNGSRRPRAQREHEILFAARKIFESHGYEETTIAEIARAVGVVEGTVLHYFRSKRGLMARVIEQFYEEITESMERGVSAIEGARNQLRYVLSSHLTLLNDNAGLCMVILSESRGRHPQPDLLRNVHKFNRRYTNIVVQIVKQGQETGEIAAHISPVLIRHILFGASEHILWNTAAGSHQQIDLDVAEQMTSVIFGGIAETGDTPQREAQLLISKLNRMLT